ncbi:MAG: aldehyde dehydrogenase [Calditrichaeota bacterium]|nr:aldehyde dehydrogenase [Calditrichota bacterium]
MKRLKNYIRGFFQPPISGAYLPDYEPATGEVLCELPDSDERDIEAAVTGAQAAFPVWSGWSEAQRAGALQAIADGIEARFDEFVYAESDDTGKPVSLARSLDIPRAIANLRFFAGLLQGFGGESYQSTAAGYSYVLRLPVGAIGAISPWNLPLYLFTWKIAPALAAGCTVVGKVSELTPLTATLLAEVIDATTLPKGAFNLVHGLGAKTGAAMAAHPGLTAITFTGGTETGRRIALAAAPLFKKLSLEMGGKNPYLVSADTDYDAALETALEAAFRNQGEICLCGSRIYVEKPLYDRFRSDFVERAKTLKVGDPRESDTRQGALISAGHFEKVLRYIELAKDEGGRVLCGGEPVKVAGRCSDGWFVAPTVIEGLPLECRVNQEEIFGPVVSITPFEVEEEAIRLANGTRYGLAATIWTQDLGKAQRMAGCLDFGVVWINGWMLRDLRTPFGGMKESGLGREGGYEALRFFTEPKSVTVGR